jgi:hypothetical protein
MRDYARARARYHLQLKKAAERDKRAHEMTQYRKTEAGRAEEKAWWEKYKPDSSINITISSHFTRFHKENPENEGTEDNSTYHA